jgi:hypothetical protein
MLPKDAEGYRTWLYFGLVIVPLGWAIAVAKWWAVVASTRRPASVILTLAASILLPPATTRLGAAYFQARRPSRAG